MLNEQMMATGMAQQNAQQQAAADPAALAALQQEEYMKVFFITIFILQHFLFYI